MVDKLYSMKIRSIRISEDIFQEMMRLRTPIEVSFLGGEQKTWDNLFNYFLILHHGNTDWREKVKEVDLKMRPELELLVDKYYLKHKIIDREELLEIYFDLENKFYKEFVQKQHKELNYEKPASNESR